jgi:hypothetical protein
MTLFYAKRRETKKGETPREWRKDKAGIFIHAAVVSPYFYAAE